MKKYILLGVVFLSINILSAKVFGQANPEDEIKATITATTTEKELEDLILFLQEHHITLLIKKHNRNENNEIIGIDLKLQRAHQQRQYSLSSNKPIPNIELGSKDDNLFITNNTNDKNSAISGTMPSASGRHLGASMSSLLEQFGFDMDLDIDEEASMMSFHEQQFDLKKLHEQMMQAFNFKEDNPNNFFEHQNTPARSKSNLPKYSFIDKPDIDKLVIINGEEATFKTLDQLAKSDQLEEVDFLKPSTAISIYGDKAKDGAIIATSKK